MKTETDQVLTPEQKKELEMAKKFADQEKQFCDLEDNIKSLRLFMVKFQDKLSPFTWICYGWDKTIKFYAHMENKAKDVARAFGASGWTRSANGYTCGQLDWKKQVGDIELIIEGAENVKPSIREEVRL